MDAVATKFWRTEDRAWVAVKIAGFGGSGIAQLRDVIGWNVSGGMSNNKNQIDNKSACCNIPEKIRYYLYLMWFLNLLEEAFVCIMNCHNTIPTITQHGILTYIHYAVVLRRMVLCKAKYRGVYIDLRPAMAIKVAHRTCPFTYLGDDRFLFSTRTKQKVYKISLACLKSKFIT